MAPTKLQPFVLAWSYKALNSDARLAYPTAEVIIRSLNAVFDCLGKVAGEVWVSDDVG